MGCPEELKPLLAGYVDDELSPVERQTVEEHLAGCAACRTLLDEQRAAAEAYAGYPVEDPSDADWDDVWRAVEGRLPAAVKRVNLERLSDLDVAEELAEEEQGEAPAAAHPEIEPPEAPKPAEPQPTVEVAPPRPEPVEAEKREPVRLGEVKRQRQPTFKPTHIRRLRHTIWAHAAGIAASLMIVSLVLMSVKPKPLKVDEFARSNQVEITAEASEKLGAPPVYLLDAGGGQQIPMVWIAQLPQSEPAGQEEIVR